MDMGTVEWGPRTSEEAVSEAMSTDVDFFLPGAFFGAIDKRASSESLPSTVNRLEAALGEPSGVETLLLFSKSFLPSLLFSFSFSLFFSESLSFSFGAGSWGAFSLPPFPAPRPVSWALEGKRGKSGEEVDDEVDKGGGFPAAPLLLSGVPCGARLMDTVEKVLKGAGVKALVASGFAETPGRELELLQETVSISEEPFPIGIGPWLLRLVIEWEGDRGWPRSVPGTSRLLRRELLLELDDVW